MWGDSESASKNTSDPQNTKIIAWGPQALLLKQRENVGGKRRSEGNVDRGRAARQENNDF